MIKQLFGLALLSTSLAASPCFAHAKLQSSTPAGNAQLAEAPRSLVLNFSEAGTLGMLKLVSDGKDTALSIDKSAKPDKSFTVSLPKLAAGNYRVMWSMVSADDGHLTKGSFTFTIAG